MGDLTGRVAIVTGAARGIGAGIAAHLTDRGATVVIVDRTDAGEGSLVVDLADPRERSTVVPRVIADHGRVDILVNNAAYHGERVPALELSEADWRQVIETNLTAPMFLAQAAAADMATRRAGVIINIAAIQAGLPVPTYTAYGASKGGIIALTKVLATEWSPRGIRVNAVAPGVISGSSFSDDGRVAALLGRSGTTAELAAAVGFLASDQASFVTGTVLTVDGGRSISRLPDPVDEQFRG